MNKDKNKISNNQKNFTSFDQLNSEKFNYIVSHYMDGSVTEMQKRFGFKTPTLLRRIQNGTAHMADLHIWGLQEFFDIPKKIFDPNIKVEDIDTLIERYHYEKNAQKVDILHDIFRYDNPNLLQKLAQKPLYAYMYPSRPNGDWIGNDEGIKETKTYFKEDGSVVDQHSNRGIVKIGAHQSLIIKESFDERNINVIRFDNYQALYGNFRFTFFIISNQNGKKTEDMINFGFYSAKKYPLKEAKKILGDISKVQLKLDLEFSERVLKG